MISVVVSVTRDMLGAGVFVAIHPKMTDTSRRHSWSSRVSVGSPSMIVIIAFALISGNRSKSLERDRTRSLSLSWAGGWERRESVIAAPVAPVAPRMAYVGILRAFLDPSRLLWCDFRALKEEWAASECQCPGTGKSVSS